MGKSLTERIAEARRLHERYAGILASDREIADIVTRYRVAIRETNELMVQQGVAKACSECASKAAGSCCFHGMEEDYDAIHLLINLLLGCKLETSTGRNGDCVFNSDRGCTLAAKCCFCLNFFCPQLIELLGPAGMETMRGAVRRETSTTWELDRAIRQWLASHLSAGRR